MLRKTGFKKKLRKKSLASLKRKLWEVFSIFVRQREADQDGYAACISCGKLEYWKYLQAGHFLPKSLGLSIYFHPQNVWQQCSFCNLAKQGNAHHYAIALKKKFGEGIVEELESIQRQPKKYYAWEYEEMIEDYKAKIKA